MNLRCVPLPIVWFVIHVVAISIGPLLGPIDVTGNLYSLLPELSASPELRRAEAVFSATNDAGLYILAGSTDFADARRAALALVEGLDGLDGIEGITYVVGSDEYLQRLEDFLFTYRFHLQDRETIERLAAGRGSEVARDALSTVYGAFSFSSLERLDADPFLLTESTLREFLQTTLRTGGGIELRDDVLTAEFEGRHYVTVTADLGRDALSVEGRGGVVATIEHLQKRITEEIDGVTWANSGVPFHTYESSRQARREITLITVLSLSVVALLLIFSFRSLAPLIATIGVIAAAAGAAFSVTSALFRELHVFTLAFGTSLIGISIDYILHYFAAHRRPDGSVPAAVLRGINLGLATTLISYAFLFVAPFPVLRQIALFSSVGLVSVYGSVRLLFPTLSARVPGPVSGALRRSRALRGLRDRFAALPRAVRVPIAVVIVGAAVPGLVSVTVRTDIRDLYTMSDELRRSESIAAEVLRSGSMGEYFIVEATSAEALLATEEDLTMRLDEAVEEGVVGSYLATSRFLPSESRQRRTYRLIGDRLLPLADEQYAALGYTVEERTAAAESLRDEYRSRRDAIITPETFFSHTFTKSLRRLWIGQVDGAFFSVVLPFHVPDPTVLSQIATKMERVHHIDTVGEINRSLNQISRISLILVAAAYLVILGVLSVVHSLSAAFRVSLAPLMGGILSVAVFGYANVSLNLFSIMGIILAMGIGIDYAIFLTERSARRDATVFAVVLSMVTTVLSFGTLSFSSFVPVARFGLSVLCGVVFSFVLALLGAPPEKTLPCGRRKYGIK